MIIGYQHPDFLYFRVIYIKIGEKEAKFVELNRRAKVRRWRIFFPSASGYLDKNERTALLKCSGHSKNGICPYPSSISTIRRKILLKIQLLTITIFFPARQGLSAIWWTDYLRNFRKFDAIGRTFLDRICKDG